MSRSNEIYFKRNLTSQVYPLDEGNKMYNFQSLLQMLPPKCGKGWPALLKKTMSNNRRQMRTDSKIPPEELR